MENVIPYGHKKRWNRFAIASACISFLYIAIFLTTSCIICYALATSPKGFGGIGALVLSLGIFAITGVATLITFCCSLGLGMIALWQLRTSDRLLRGKGLIQGALTVHTLLAVIYAIIFVAGAGWIAADRRHQTIAADAAISDARGHVRVIMASLTDYANKHHGLFPEKLADIAETQPPGFQPGLYNYRGAHLSLEKINAARETSSNTGVVVVLIDKRSYPNWTVVMGVIDKNDADPSSATRSDQMNELLNVDRQSRDALNLPQFPQYIP